MTMREPRFKDVCKDLALNDFVKNVGTVDTISWDLEVESTFTDKYPPAPKTPCRLGCGMLLALEDQHQSKENCKAFFDHQLLGQLKIEVTPYTGNLAHVRVDRVEKK